MLICCHELTGVLNLAWHVITRSLPCTTAARAPVPVGRASAFWPSLAQSKPPKDTAQIHAQDRFDALRWLPLAHGLDYLLAQQP